MSNIEQRINKVDVGRVGYSVSMRDRIANDLRQLHWMPMHNLVNHKLLCHARNSIASQFHERLFPL